MILFIIQLDCIERVQLLSIIYNFLIEFHLINSTFIFELIILNQTKMKWSGLFDVDYIFIPRAELT